jgi:hypothetical protein
MDYHGYGSAKYKCNDHNGNGIMLIENTSNAGK